MFWGDPGIFSNFFRWFFSLLDGIGYFFLGGIFNVFFTIANAQFFQGDVINTFYTRIQMILGIFMIFRISITLLQIIVNPDVFKDKQKGAGSIVMRIAVMLVLLTLIVPIEGISESDSNPLNQQIRTNGILFGFLNQVQNTVVQDNVLGKLILGYNVDEDGSNLQLNGLDSVGDVLTAEIAHAFITPTLNDDADANVVITSENYEEVTACPTDIAPSLNPAVTSGALLDHINDTCMGDDGETYAFEYIGFGGLVCSIVMTIIVIGFTLDIAVRAIKLALLRLIAPIPIISYISTGQEKDGAFGNWVKTLTSTYLSLFIRLIIIYFGIYLIILLRNGELVTWVDTSVLANIFVIIGILVFMKEAPKFFQDMLGIKGDGKLFSGIGTMLGAAALAGGLAGSVIGSARTGWSEGQELGYGTGKKLLRAVGAGAGGLFGGAFAGTKALATADKKQASAVFAAMQKRQALRGTGSTWFGRTKSGASALFLGSSLGGRASKQVELYDSLTKAAQAHKSMVEDEALKDTNALGYLKYIDTNTGKEETMVMNYREFEGMYESARAAGEKVMAFTDAAGNKVSLDVGRMNANRLNDFKESQSTAWLIDQYTKKPEDRNAKVVGTATDLEYAASKVDMNIDPYQYGGKPTDEIKGIKGVIGASINEARKIKSDARMQYKIQDDKAINNTNK